MNFSQSISNKRQQSNSNHPPQEWNEAVYLELNQDVAEAVQKGLFSSGWEHFCKHGFSEDRPGSPSDASKSSKESLEEASLIPPSNLHNVGSGDFIAVGNHLIKLLVETAGLMADDRVLDIGCGTGRVACALTKYLKNGTYDGLDIVKPSIDWCQKAYSARPNFYFHFSNVYNKMYNPKGIILANEYHFPFEDNSFDFVFLTSVFTHMLPPDMENYLAEISRVLCANGTCFITFFLLTEDSVKLIEDEASDFSFRYDLQGCRVENQEVPENVVAFSEEKVRQLYRKYNLEILEPARYGRWSGRKDFLSYQDIIIAKKMIS